MIAMKLGWLALEGVLLWGFLGLGSGLALALAAVLLLLPLLCFAGNLRLRRELEVKAEAPGSLRKGDEGTITVTVQNPTALPVLRLNCRVTVENQLNREGHTQTLSLWVPARGREKAGVRVASDYCGRLRIQVDRVVLYDAFGLIGLPCDRQTVSHVTVQPDTFPATVTLLPEVASQEDSILYAQDRPGKDLTETYQIREYVPGDSPRQIHWKLSGKFDRLLVRDPALPISRNVLVFWERTGETGDLTCIDAQAESVVSLCRGLLEGGVGFTLGWNDTDRNLCILHEIPDMDTFVAVIPRLLRATGRSQGVSGAGLLIQTRMDALCAHMLYIARTPQPELEDLRRFGHVTALVCGEELPEGAIPFGPEGYDRQLAQIEM